MASEIRVDKINSLSGVGTVTLSPTGVDISGITTVQTLKVGTGLTASEDGDVFFTGVCTATTFAGAHSGSGANLTSLPAAQLSGTLPALSAANLTSIPAGNLTGALPAISGANLTGIAATDNVRTGILDVAGIATFRSDVNIPNVNGGQIGGRRNKIYNGKMDVDQRNSGSSVTLTNNLTTYIVDRFSVQPVALDEATDMSAQQVDDGPDGFAHSLKVTTNTAESAIGSNEFVSVYQKMEGQDFQDLEYNLSSAKDITMSFYVKSSITGTFGFTVYRDEPGTDRIINKTYTIDSANTWERKTITIAGDTGKGIQNTTGAVWWNCWHLAAGSDYDSSISGVWQNYSTTNWAGGHVQDGVITTAGATWQITGVQLEFGSTATVFEHRPYAEELSACQRYYYMHANGGDTSQYEAIGNASWYNGSEFYTPIHLPTTMRAAPSLDHTSGSNYYYQNNAGGGGGFNGFSAMWASSKNVAYLSVTGSSGTQGAAAMIRTASTSAKLGFSAEL